MDQHLRHGRFGLLWLRNGNWGDKQIVSPAYLKMATTPSAARAGLWFLWWLIPSRDCGPGFAATAFRAVGQGGNVIYIEPESDLVVCLAMERCGRSSFQKGSPPLRAEAHWTIFAWAGTAIVVEVRFRSDFPRLYSTDASVYQIDLPRRLFFRARATI